MIISECVHRATAIIRDLMSVCADLLHLVLDL